MGGAGSGFLRLWLVPSLAGVVGPMAEATNAAVERREARRPDRKGRKDASQASSACFASTQRVPRRHPAPSGAPLPFAWRRGSRKGHYGAGRRRKTTAGGAMAMTDIHFVDTTLTDWHASLCAERRPPA